MNKSAIFLSAIICITMLSCFFTKSLTSKNKKSLKSNSKSKLFRPALDYSKPSKLNFTNLYPFLDNTYNEAWDEAKNSGENNVAWNEYYFCQNLTIAGAIHEKLHKEIKNFNVILKAHKKNLTKFANKKHFRINKTLSSNALNSTSPEYDDFLANLSKKYENSYMIKIKEIEKVFQNNLLIGEELNTKCNSHRQKPQIIIIKPDNNTITTHEGEFHTETFEFIEFTAKAKNMNKNEKKIFDFLVQMHERINKLKNILLKN